MTVQLFLLPSKCHPVEVFRLGQTWADLKANPDYYGGPVYPRDLGKLQDVQEGAEAHSWKIMSTPELLCLLYLLPLLYMLRCAIE